MEQGARSRLGAVVRVASGNFLEMYDFMVFGYYAAAIGAAFFPAGSPYLSLLLALAPSAPAFSCGRSARSCSARTPTAAGGVRDCCFP